MSRQLLLEDELATLDKIRFLVLDIETTGTSAASSEITEIAALLVQGGEVLARLDSLVAIGGPIPPVISALTGIYPQMLAGAPPLSEVLLELSAMAEGAVVVGHNVRFDLSFINHGLGSLSEMLPLDNPTLDTLTLARKLLFGEVSNFKLGSLAAELKLPHQPSHRAMADVLATVDLLHHLIERASAFGVGSLPELQNMPGRLSRAHAAKMRACSYLPRRPGIYWMEESDGAISYVGKAVDINARFRSYFTSDSRPKVDPLLTGATRIGYMTFASETEAVVAEARLIRRLAPRHNRLLNKSEKGYRALVISPGKGGSPSLRVAMASTRTKAGEIAIGPFRSRRSAQSAEYALRCALQPELHPDWPTQDEPDPPSASSVWQVPARLWSERIWTRMAALAGSARFEEAERLREGAQYLFLAVSRQQATLLLQETDEITLARDGESGGVLKAAAGRLRLTPRTHGAVDLHSGRPATASALVAELMGEEPEQPAQAGCWMPELSAFEERWVLWRELTRSGALRLEECSLPLALPIAAAHRSFLPRPSGGGPGLERRSPSAQAVGHLDQL
ncbi:MAG: exonuclease domain-containing protein [Actinomycetota bacterium]|nr:exonuclease domain-containing protein [Actinomycetota bacterium]